MAVKQDGGAPGAGFVHAGHGAAMGKTAKLFSKSVICINGARCENRNFAAETKPRAIFLTRARTGAGRRRGMADKEDTYMTNKILTLLAALVLVAGCNAKTKEKNMRENEPSGKKVLVAYFSFSGTTRGYAEKIAKLAHADLFEIQAAQPYTAQDVDWTNDSSRVNKEMKTNPDSRPAIARKVDGLAQYDVVFLGFPIWWYVEPNIINTFLETQDFKGKTIAPFFTSQSSGPGETDERLHASIGYDVSWKPATRLNGMSDKALAGWVAASLE